MRIGAGNQLCAISFHNNLMSNERSLRIQGIWYESRTAAAIALGCDTTALCDSLNGATQGIPFEKFMKNREEGRTKDRFWNGMHYKAVMEKMESILLKMCL